MNFRNWINEATLQLSPKDWHSLRDMSGVYIGPNGKMVVGYPEYGTPYVEVQPKAMVLRLQHINPQSKAFRDIVSSLKTRFPNIGNWNAEVYGPSHNQTGNDKHYRNVSYWLKQPQAEFNSGGVPEFVYHGTATNLWYNGIQKHGLLPRHLNKMGAGGSYGSQGDSLSYADRIYLSVHPDAAARLASRQAAEKHGGQPLILKIKTRQLFPEKFVADEDSRAETATKSAQKVGSVGYRGRIPASCIQPFLLGKREDTSNRIRYTWSSFKDVPIGIHPLTARLKENPNWFSPSQTPYYWALLDAGIIEEVDGPRTESGHSTGKITILKKPVNNEEIQALIKSSPWVQNADRLMKDVHDWGMKGVKSMNYVKLDAAQTKKQKKVVDMMTKAKLIEDSGGYFKVAYFSEKPVIALAKMMQKDRIDYRELIDTINSIPKE